MESVGGKWIETMNDGVILFKNISSAVKEVVKDEKKEIEYEHNEANTVLTFEDAKLQLTVAGKYIYGEEKKLCTIVDKVEDESQNLVYLKARYLHSDEEFELDPEQAKQLNDKVEITIRLHSKSGSKSIVK